MITLRHVHLPVSQTVLPMGHCLLDLHAAKGSLHWVIGPSGSGKTALLETIALQHPLPHPSHGSMTLLGHDLHTHSPTALLTRLRQRIGLVQEQPLFRNDWNVFQNVALPLRLNRLRRRDIIRETTAILSWLRLDAVAENNPAMLSATTRLRVAVARSLIHRPDVLLIDAPALTLDPDLADFLLPALSSLAKGGCTIFLATQDRSLTSALPAPIFTLPQQATGYEAG